MPAGRAAALICDTGALIDCLVECAADHRLFRNATDEARTRYVPGLVLAEVDYVGLCPAKTRSAITSLITATGIDPGRSSFVNARPATIAIPIVSK